MKTKQTISKLLGISQKNMAILLSVSEGSFTMFNYAKRSLPPHARELLLKIMSAFQTFKSEDAQKIPAVVEQRNKEKLALEKMLKKNKLQQLLLNNQIEIKNAKYESHVTALQVVDYLTSANIAAPVLNVEASAKKGMVKVGVPLAKDRIRLETLKAEEIAIMDALKNY